MATKKRRGGGAGGKKGGPVGIVSSFLILLLAAGGIFAYAKANNIDSISGFADWTKTTSQKFNDCLKPDINFWSCDNPLDPGDTKPNSSNTSKDKPNSGDSKDTPSTGDKPTTEDNKPPVNGNNSGGAATLAKLKTIPVKNEQKVDYDRGEWKHWIGDRCNDTRQQVLKDQAVSYKLDASNCKVASGKWIDPYTGETFTDPGKLDIDHVYALGAAAKNGGNDWDAKKKEQFANDKSHLLAVSASANRSKSDRNPAEWWIDNDSYSCQFATKYVDVASKYGLSFSSKDVSALEKGLKTCS